MECALCSVECDVECGMGTRNAECGMWNVECLRGVGLGWVRG